jgi:hypothetical protein
MTDKRSFVDAELNVRRAGDLTKSWDMSALCRVGGMAAPVKVRGQLALTLGCTRLRLATT